MESPELYTISQIMNANSIHGMRTGGKGNQQSTVLRKNKMIEFLQDVPQEFYQGLKEVAASGNREATLKMCCDYVVKYFHNVSYDSCLHHGDFVYELLRKTLNFDQSGSGSRSGPRLDGNIRSCRLCGAPDTNSSTCPKNKKAKHPNLNRHILD